MVTGEIDWTECPLVEIKPRVQSGAPVLRNTRMPVNAIVENFDYGVSVAEIAEQFEVPRIVLRRFLPTRRVIELRVPFENVPVGVPRFLIGHKVLTVEEMNWPPQLENCELLAAERSGFGVMATADQNIRYQQNLTGRQLALVVLGSNIWSLVRTHGAAIASKVATVTPGSYEFIQMPLPPRPRTRYGLKSRPPGTPLR